MKVLQFPLARITLFFVLGILTSYSLKLVPLVALFLLLINFTTCITVLYILKSGTKRNLFFEIMTYSLFFSIGILTQALHTESFQENNYINQKNTFDKKHIFQLTLKEQLNKTNFNDRYVAQLNFIDDKKVSGKIMLHIDNANLRDQLIIGDQLQIKGQLHRNTIQKNPNQFDYAKYLENKQIYAQLYAAIHQIKKGSIINKDIWYYASKLRNRSIQNLEESKFNSQELNVVIALIMGQQQNIDPEIKQEYQYAGAVHILSVSGLHIGFIMFFVSFILQPLPMNKRGSFIKLIITILTLFLFGVLTGLSPSVVRSVVMFSFFAIGFYLRRSTNIYHTLLVSIFLILLFKPSFLFDVGFQLSYAALFFIVWLQPEIARIWQPKNNIKKYFWDILSVSIAAQIGTLPLSVYYFHQFPGLFFLTNIIVIPVIGFIMGLGIVVIFLASCNWVPYYPAKTLELSIYYLNKIISYIASFEQFVVKEIPLNSSLLISSYLVIIALVIAFQLRNTKSLFLFLATIIIFQITAIATKYDIQNQKEFIVLNRPKKTQIIERNSTLTIVYSEDSNFKNQKDDRILSSYLTANFSSIKEHCKLRNLFYFNENKILLIDSSMVYPKNIHPDIVILTQSPRLNIERLIQTLKPKIIVADGSNYKSIQKKWSETCMQQKIPFHATHEKGFYEIK